MFRDRAQQCAAIRIMLGRPLEHLWTTTGPTYAACNVLKGDTPLSKSDQLLVRSAFDFWNNDGEAPLGELVHGLDQRQALRVMLLWNAVLGGHEQIDRFVRNFVETEHWIGFMGT